MNIDLEFGKSNQIVEFVKSFFVCRIAPIPTIGLALLLLLLLAMSHGGAHAHGHGDGVGDRTQSHPTVPSLMRCPAVPVPVVMGALGSPRHSPYGMLRGLGDGGARVGIG